LFLITKTIKHYKNNTAAMCRNIPPSTIIALRFYLLYTTRMNVPAWRLTCKLENRNVRELH